MGVNNSNEKKEIGSELENSASSGIPEELQDFKKICSSRCSICNSGVLKEVHELRKNGTQYDRIVELVQTEHNIILSPASLSRHFKSYLAFKTEMSTKIIKNDVLEEITSQSVHLKKTAELLDLAYDSLLARLKSKTYVVDVADLEKLAKLRYQVLNGENPEDNDLVAIFQKASNEYGLDIQQGVLFKA